MDKNTINTIIRMRYNKLPEEVKNVIIKSDFESKIKEVGSKSNLLIDQIGTLHNEILLITLGIEPSSTFVDNIISELGINREKATAIAKDVNELIFNPIRTYLRKWEEQEENQSAEADKAKQGVTDLERVGGFSIEPSNGQNGNSPIPANLPGAEEVTESKDDLVAGIENPPPIRPSSQKTEFDHTDIIVDNLLASPVAAVEKKIKVETPPSPPVEQVPKKPAGPDSYREPVE